MLTVILLVVLGGGAGLLTVWLIDPARLSQRVGRLDLGSLRVGRRRATTAEPDQRTDPTPGPVLAERAAAPAPAPLEVVASRSTSDAPGFAPLPAPSATAGPVRRRRRGDVPAAFTAIEGTYREVAVPPLWRRALSLLLLLLLLAGTGLGLAAVAAAALGTAAELLDGAIG